MTTTFEIKRGDTSPGLEYKLPIYSEGSGVLTGASVRFLMRDRGFNQVVDAPADIHDEGGVVRYAWADGDTDASGVYFAEFEVTYADGAVETFPAGGWLTVTVMPDLGGAAP
ncbi:hypothetical protein [Rhodovulum steppense]|uniref:BppU N-terminal domain-containing protein n=1 Tax=Rhodovulum steppense TaxID=540251 RepID=A0A4R1YV29_9RHOB|nr:hypothetical protein [Rhodovulum steppense]TCM84766.1 hypothetical protein EV216_11084 [Rhodovulum steppense]